MVPNRQNNSRIHLFLEIIQIRPLASTDYHRGHLSVLEVLTVVTDPGEAAWVAQFHAMRATPRTYHTLVIVDKATDRIVAVGTVFLERKFLRGLGTVGHIEDIAVDKKQQGKKLGLRIIDALTYISENSGSYKTILNCSEDNIRESSYYVTVVFGVDIYTAFYKKCGYEKKESEMVGLFSRLFVDAATHTSCRRSTRPRAPIRQSSRHIAG
jgi:glucosamine-phosphate N-acetyltransferase